MPSAVIMCNEVNGPHWRALSKDKDIYLHDSNLTFRISIDP